MKRGMFITAVLPFLLAVASAHIVFGESLEPGKLKKIRLKQYVAGGLL